MDFSVETLLAKMWDSFDKHGIETVVSPWKIVREGRARNEVRRDELLMLAQVEKDAQDIRDGKKQLMADGTLAITGPQRTTALHCDGRAEPTLTLPDVIERGKRAATFAAFRSEINVSKAILFAEDQLANDEQSPPNRDVDEDWLFRWREYAGKVSSEDLQKLWGSVLAGEVKAPGAYSIRTLEFLKTLSKPEAEMISKLASYVIFDFIFREQLEYLESKGVTSSMLLFMQELGLLSGVDAVGLKKTYTASGEGKFFRCLISHNKALILEHTDPSRKLEIPAFILTAVGREILGLGSFEPDIEYMRLVGKEFVRKGFRVKLVDWVDVSETLGRFYNEQEITLDETIPFDG